MTDSKGCSPEEDDLAFTKASMESNPASAYPVNHFIEHFAPPPNYSGGESYEVENLPLRSTGTAGATGNFRPSETPRATGAPAAAPEEPFNFSFYAPLKSKKRYWIALFAILLLVIAGLTALSGILAHKLSTQSKPQNITISVYNNISRYVLPNI
ncbi:hypothetical protein NA56DRAFT_654924 [Hyaloscypha hepaticicola]|uniref:Uncharacterized protein n=1 Tax=Hyaloscypha hepaticicola TaxID=2082293 RepID=A0A2J6QJ75_9HELO|nr:hypothetical protein NA56DRAFT_654924 [Hyaloscypha hepaticicola]